jgi:microcystin-dependent protein
MSSTPRKRNVVEDIEGLLRQPPPPAVPNSGWVTGDVKQTLRETAPAGWAFGEAQNVLRVGIYAKLFALWGTKYGIGDGVTTFGMPDLRGRILIPKGTHTDVDALGDSDGLAVASRTPKHVHEKGTLGTSPDGVNVLGGGAGATGFNINTHFHAVTGSTASNGPAFITVNTLIKL